MVSLTIHGVKLALGCEGWWPITEHAEAQLEPTVLRKISRAVAFHSLSSTILWEQWSPKYVEHWHSAYCSISDCHSHPKVTLSQALLLSSAALVCVPMMMTMSLKHALFTGRSTKVPSCFVLNRVKMRSYEHFSLLGIYNFDFFCRTGKGNKKLSCFASFVSILE